MIQYFHSIAIRLSFCMIKPQPLFLSLINFTAGGIPLQCKDSNPITTRAFKQRKTRVKKSIYTCKNFLSISLSDLVPLEHQFCSPVLPGINLNFMHTAILHNGSFPHVNSKFCRFCRKYYLHVSLSLNATILS